MVDTHTRPNPTNSMALRALVLACALLFAHGFTPLARRTPSITPRAGGATVSMATASPKKVLVLGGDGFCGWPTSLHLSDEVYPPRVPRVRA